MADKILIVDDDPDMLMVLRWALSPVGDLLEACEGRGALRLIAEERPRLILLDVAMPGMSGIEVLRRAREIDPTAIIVMLTGLCDIEIAKEALDGGARAYVTKPFDDAYLRNEVRRLLEITRKKPPTGDSDSDGDSGRPWRVRGG
jgi:DNA-binding response OmpR family regulator